MIKKTKQNKTKQKKKKKKKKKKPTNFRPYAESNRDKINGNMFVCLSNHYNLCATLNR